MFGSVLRLFLRPATLAALAVAGAWFLWFILPERPIRSHEVARESSSFQIGTDGRTTERYEFYPGPPKSVQKYQYFRGDFEIGRETPIIERKAIENRLGDTVVVLMLPDHSIEVFDKITGATRFKLPADPDRDAFSLIFGENRGERGLLIHSTSDGGRWTMHDPATGQPTGLTFAPANGKRLWTWGKHPYAYGETDNPRTLMVFDAKTGQLLNQLPLFDGVPEYGWFPAFNEPHLAYTAAEPCRPGDKWCDWTVHVVSLPDLKSLAELKIRANATDRHLSLFWSTDGAHLEAYYTGDYGLWDMRTTPPTSLNHLIMADSQTIFSKRHFIQGVLQNTLWAPRTVRLGDANTHEILWQRLAGTGNDFPRFSRDERYVVWSEVQQRVPKWVPTSLTDFLSIPRVDYVQAVLDTQERKLVHLAPGERFTGFGPNNETIWTASQVPETYNPQFGMSDVLRFQQFSTVAPSPPWWLWLLSVICITVISRALCRSRKSRLNEPEASATVV
ncbi:MAG: hypothetical protein ACJ8C4_21635 [Gemmataceae bacterium]